MPGTQGAPRPQRPEAAGAWVGPGTEMRESVSTLAAKRWPLRDKGMRSRGRARADSCSGHRAESTGANKRWPRITGRSRPPPRDGGCSLNRAVLDALLPVAIATLVTAACLALTGATASSDLLAVGLGVASALLIARAYWILSDAWSRLDVFRRALLAAFAGDGPLGPVPEGDDEIGQMGRALRTGHTALLNARAESRRLAALAAKYDRRAECLAEFTAAAIAAPYPGAVWPALGRALHTGFGSDWGYRVLLRDEDTGELREAAAAGLRPERPAWTLEKPLQSGGRISGILQVRHSDTAAEARSFLEALTAHAALSWANAEDHRRTREDAETDALTGLRNRRWLDRHAAEELERARRIRRPFAIAMLDIDRFGGINEQYGPAAGDTALRAAATCIRAAARPTDGVARYGGGQFVLLLPETALDAAMVVAEHARLAVARAKVAHGGRPLALTVSVGCAAWPLDQTGWEAVLAAAETALHHAKRSGRNRVEAVSLPW